MRKLIAAFKVSMDLKFQGPDGYADWVDGWSEDYDLSPQIDACLLGGAMFRGYEGYWSAMAANPTAPSPMTGTLATAAERDWCERIPTLPHYVLSRTMTEARWPNVHLLRGLDDIAALKEQEGRDIYLMGGGLLLRTLVDAGLVDEVRLLTYPLVAGGPHALFGTDERRHGAALVSASSTAAGLLRTTYRIAQPLPA